MAGETQIPVYGVLLAAGASLRMGRPKALLEVGGKTLLQWGVDALVAGGCTHVTVVTGAHVGAMAPRIPPGIGHVHARRWRSGMRTSLRCAAYACPPGALVVHHVDGPDVRPETIRALIAALVSRPVVPIYRGQRGHPVVLPPTMRPALCRRDLRPLSVLMEEAGMDRVRVDDAGVLSNVNTPCQFAKLQWMMREFRLDGLHRG